MQGCPTTSFLLVITKWYVSKRKKRVKSEKERTKKKKKRRVKEVLIAYHSLIWLVRGSQHRCSVWRIGTLYVYSPSLLSSYSPLFSLLLSHHPLYSSYLPLKSLFQVLDYNDLDPSIVGPCYSGYEVPYPSLLSPLSLFHSSLSSRSSLSLLLFNHPFRYPSLHPSS